MAEYAARSIRLIDEQTSRLVPGRIRLSCRPVNVAIGDGYVWATCEQQRLVEKISPASGSSTVVDIPVGAEPIGITATPGAIWVACSRADQLWRLDPSTDRVVSRIHLAGSPQDVASVSGNVWVTVAQR